MAGLIAIHVLAAVLWVGGMFFAWMVLRPSASVLDAAQRLLLWKNVLKRFFNWVWMAVIALGISGYIMLFEFYGGMGGAAVYIHIMHALYIVMTLIFMYVFVGLYFRFASHVNKHDWGLAGDVLARIRRLVGLNLLLGCATIIIASAGRFIVL